ncbi:1-acyl-sn-glycerol-3-phosphate acyltransferase (1-AGP acyltransferase) (1-AGPAT) (Lysophosphatidic acid acyltransferase) (LPAAT), partial [Durusdinium trenchii]
MRAPPDATRARLLEARCGKGDPGDKGGGCEDAGSQGRAGEVGRRGWVVAAEGVVVELRGKEGLRLGDGPDEERSSTVCWNIRKDGLNPFWWATVVNKRTTPLPKGAILMSNHLSFADSFLVSKVLMPTYEAKFVAMKMVFDLPFGGWAIRFCEDLKIVFELCEDGVTWRTKKGTTKAMFKLAQKHADNGTSIMVYPEGELSRDGEMIDFKDGFFKFALKNNMPIVPLAMWGNKNVWPTDTFHMNPGKLNIAVGENIEINDFDTVDTVREKTFAAIVALRNDLPLFKERGEMDIQRFKNHIANEERRLEEIEEAKAAKREVAVRVSPADGNGDIEAPSPNLGS